MATVLLYQGKAMGSWGVYLQQESCRSETEPIRRCEQAKLQEMTYWEHVICKMEICMSHRVIAQPFGLSQSYGAAQLYQLLHYAVFQCPTRTAWLCHSEVEEISVSLPLTYREYSQESIRR